MNKQLSELSINTNGQLCEIVVFSSDCSEEYKVIGITEHIIFGIFFSFIK
jgi:hypothetical protein